MREKTRNILTLMILITVLNMSLEIRKITKKEQIRSNKITHTGKECTPPSAYVFLKKHKAASTTFRQMLSHFARSQGFYPAAGEKQLIGPQGGCYPAKFDKRCWPAEGHLNKIQGMKLKNLTNLKKTI